ncbi:tripartite motif-containing protein 2-like [Scyliorhinus canicula]|uniref:tripartite motif-containing protein 2-like n=1 Tax=Scyliorhinus canicula TaxID=7830 RepID=UPI0018F50152|nr:tripartite motif-containing protein 2-like [Scyliorhinus canicula]
MDYSLETSKRKEKLLRTMHNLQVKSGNTLQKTGPLLNRHRGMGMVTVQHLNHLSQTTSQICQDLENIENLVRFRQNDLMYEIENPGGVNSDGLSGIHCCLDGTTYIVSVSSPRVHVLNRSGQVFQTLYCVQNQGRSKEPFLPEDVTLTRAGMVAVTDMVGGVIRIFNPHSKFSEGEWIKIGKIDCPKGIGVDPSGNLLVADYTAGKVHIFSIDHAFKVLNVQTVTGLRGPRYICSTYDGGIVVSEECGDVKVYGSKLKLMYSLGAKYCHQFGNPAGVCTDPEGNIMVVDEQKRNVTLFPKCGSPICIVSAGLRTPTTLACSSYGLLFVMDTGGNCIKVFKYRVAPYYASAKSGPSSKSPLITPREKDS